MPQLSSSLNSAVLGVCELPWTTLKQICELLGISPHAISFDYAGINHVGWFYDIHLGSRDLVHEYCNLLGDEQGFPTAERIQKCSGVPLKYLRLHYEATDVLQEQRNQKQSRAQVLQELSSLAFPSYVAGDCNVVLGRLKQRPAPWYEHCVGPLIRAFTGERITTPFFLSARRSQIDAEPTVRPMSSKSPADTNAAHGADQTIGACSSRILQRPWGPSLSTSASRPMP